MPFPSRPMPLRATVAQKARIPLRPSSSRCALAPRCFRRSSFRYRHVQLWPINDSGVIFLQSEVWTLLNRLRLELGTGRRNMVTAAVCQGSALD